MEIGFSKAGVLNGIKVTVFTDCGWNPNDNYLSVAADHIDNGESIIHVHIHRLWCYVNWCYTQPTTVPTGR